MMVIVDAPHFYAAAIFKNAVCVHAAPILAWAKGWGLLRFEDYCRHKHWRVTRQS